MSRPAQFKQSNIMRSVTWVIGDTVTVGVTSYPVLHNYSWGDPEEIRQPSQDPDSAWAATTWLETMAGRQGANILQVDVFSRVGAPGTSHHDPYGLTANDIMDEIEAVFAGLMPGGGTFFWLPIYDFTDPDLPIDTGFCLAVAPLGEARPGMPESRSYLGVQDGFNRVTARFRFTMIRDMVRGAGFMTE